MKALSLWQPWASLVALGVKHIETRSWRTSYRGPLAIHAAARRPDVELLEDGFAGELWDSEDDPVECLAQWAQADPRDYLPDVAVPAPRDRWTLDLAPDFAPHPMPLGAVVATARLVDCVPMVDIAPEAPEDLVRTPQFLLLSGLGRHMWVGPDGIDVEAQRPYGDFRPGRWAWLLADVKAISPIRARGRQGLFEIDLSAPRKEARG